MDERATLAAALAGRYEIDREIGAGGMATVYLAHDVRHDRSVALKLLKPELGAVLGVERFLAEIHVTAKLQHPNLLPLFDSGEASGLLFYVMPFVDGESLRQRIVREKQLPVDEAVHIARSVASALDYAHRHGVIHRDLKPENILLHEGEPLVADFGIALAVSNAGGARITQTGLSLGTPQYMSPEQATGDRQIDGRTDIYSLGAVLYEMLTGEPPHTGATAQAIVARLLTETPRSIRATRHSVPPYVDAAVARALEKLPGDRWPTAAQFGEALAGHVSPEAAPATADPSASRVTPRVRHAVVVSAACVVVAVTALAVWRETHRSDAETRRSMRFDLGAPELAATAYRPLAISPDGQAVLFVAPAAHGGSQLFVRTLSDVHPRAISGVEDPMMPFFSPDGRTIGYVSGSQIKTVPVEGGSPSLVTASEGNVYGAVWLPDNNIVFSGGSRLWIVPVTGGTPKPVVDVDPRVNVVGTRWPLAIDNNTVLFTSWNASLATARIAKLSLSSRRVTVFDLPGTTPIGIVGGNLVYAGTTGFLTAVPFDMKRLEPAGHPVTLQDQVQVSALGGADAVLSANGTLVYQAGSAERQLVLEGTHGAAQTLSADPRAYSYPRFSPDGKKVAVTVDAPGRADIWLYSFADGALTRLTRGGKTNDRPEWSWDGKRVLYRSERGGQSGLWWQAADGTGAEEPLFQPTKGEVWEGVLSPDQRFLIYRTGSTNEGDIWYRALAGDTTPHPVANSPQTDWNARISSDGKWIAYASAESGHFQVYVRPFPGPGERYQVSTDGGAMPIWSRDGRRLYYANGRQLVVATLSYSPTFSVASRSTTLEDYFGNLNPGHAGYDVSPIDERVLLARPVASQAQAIVALDWAAELRSIVAKAPK